MLSLPIDGSIEAAFDLINALLMTKWAVIAGICNFTNNRGTLLTKKWRQSERVVSDLFVELDKQSRTAIIISVAAVD